MMLDEAIEHAEKVAEEKEKAAKEWHKNQVRKCELISFSEMDYTHENECKKCASEHRQLAEWLKDYKRLLEQKSNDDTISRKAVYEQINSWNHNGEYSYTNATYYLMKRIRDIPSVTPQPKKEAKVLKNHNAYENTGILEQLVKKQNNLLDIVKAWNNAIEKNGYVN